MEGRGVSAKFGAEENVGEGTVGCMLRSCGLNVQLVQIWRRVLEGDKGVFIDNKDD